MTIVPVRPDLPPSSTHDYVAPEPVLWVYIVRRATGAFVLALGFGACATYHSRPLLPESELSSLREMATLSQLHIEHARPGEEAQPSNPEFDPRDGLNEAELVAVALTINPSLRARRLEIGEARALLVSAGLWPNPELDVFVRPGVGGAPATGVGLDLLFSLLRPDERPAKRAVAEARLATVRAEIAAEELRVAAEVRRRRIAVLAAERREQLLEQEATLRDEAVALIHHQRELGEATETASLLVELDRTSMQRTLRAARAEYEHEQRALRQVVGVPPDYDLPLTRETGALAVPVYGEISDDELDQRVLTGRLDLRALAAAYDVKEAELRLAIARQYPHLRLGPSYEKDVEGSEGLGLGASIELPLFDRNQGEIAGQAVARDQARAEYVALLHELRARAVDARALLSKAKDEVELQQRETEPLIQRAEALFKAAFEARELTVFEWITMRSRAVQARTDLLDALTRYAEATVEFETATGMLLGTPVEVGSVEKGSGR